MSFFLWAGKLQSDASGSMLDDCWSEQSREVVWLQLLTYMQSEGSNAYYVNSSAIFSGKVCHFFCLWGSTVTQIYFESLHISQAHHNNDGNNSAQQQSSNKQM